MDQTLNASGNFAYLQLWGGDVNASNYSTPFGGSQGLLWNWSGPQAFSSTIQNPHTADTAWGTYQLIVTEKRNGCTATASQNISITNFAVLLTNDLLVNGTYGNNSIQEGNNMYRIKAIAKDGKTYYSAMTTVALGASGLQSFYLASNSPGATMTVVANTSEDCQGVIVIYNIAGQTVSKKSVYLSKGPNAIGLPTVDGQPMNMKIVSLFINGRVAWSQKVIF